MKSASRSLALLPLAAALAASQGCACLTREDSGRSLSYAARTAAHRTRDDAAATAATFTGIPAAVQRNWAHSVENLRTTSELYCGE